MVEDRTRRIGLPAHVLRLGYPLQPEVGEVKLLRGRLVGKVPDVHHGEVELREVRLLFFGQVAEVPHHLVPLAGLQLGAGRLVPRVSHLGERRRSPAHGVHPEGEAVVIRPVAGCEALERPDLVAGPLGRRFFGVPGKLQQQPRRHGIVVEALRLRRDGDVRGIRLPARLGDEQVVHRRPSRPGRGRRRSQRVRGRSAGAFGRGDVILENMQHDVVVEDVALEAVGQQVHLCPLDRLALRRLVDALFRGPLGVGVGKPPARVDPL